MESDDRRKKIVKVREILHDIKFGFTDEQLMTKYGLSDRDLQVVRNKLSTSHLETGGRSGPEEGHPFTAGEISSSVNSARPADHLTPSHRLTEKPVRQDLQESDHSSAQLGYSGSIPKPESSGKESPLLQCPACGTNWTQEVRECPRCGLIASKYLEMQARSEQYGGAEPQEGEREFKPRRSKTKSIMIAGLAGLLVIGLVILMKDWRQVDQKGSPQVVSKPSVGTTAESDDSKSGSEGTVQYSAEVLSEMVRISVIDGLNGIGARGDSVQDRRASELFGKEMPSLNEVVTSIIFNEYNCGQPNGRLVYALCDYLNFIYKAEAIDFDNVSDKSLILKGLALREAKFKNTLTSLSAECKEGIQGLVSLVEDTVPAAKAQKAYYR